MGKGVKRPVVALRTAVAGDVPGILRKGFWDVPEVLQEGLVFDDQEGVVVAQEGKSDGPAVETERGGQQKNVNEKHRSLTTAPGPVS